MDDSRVIAVNRWLTQAHNDLVTAKTMLTTDPPITDTACFHAQQCVEKSLKAFLVYRDIQVEKTHYLPRLVEMCAADDARFRSLEDTAAELTDYAVADRYPDNWREIPVEEAESAVGKAEKAMEHVRHRLGFR
jgi:HEPN domain-containing protein